MFGVLEILIAFPLLIVGLGVPIAVVILLYLIYTKLVQIERNTREPEN